FSQTLRTEQQPSALPHGGARPQAPVAPHSTRPQRARAAAWRSGPAWPGRAPRAASRSAAGRADDGRNAAAPVRGAAGVYGRVAFELSAGVPASAARAPGLERETAPSSGEARRLRRRAGSHVDSKEKKKSESSGGGSGRRPRAGDSGTGRAGTAGRNSARKRKARCSHDLLTAEGKADVRHAHGPGSTALELWPCELAQARATGIKTKTKKRGGGCEAGGKGQRG
ncbi:unnamed protein product, partial [Prorocentrum cordatum]